MFNDQWSKSGSCINGSSSQSVSSSLVNGSSSSSYSKNNDSKINNNYSPNKPHYNSRQQVQQQAPNTESAIDVAYAAYAQSVDYYRNGLIEMNDKCGDFIGHAPIGIGNFRTGLLCIYFILILAHSTTTNL